MGEPSIENLSFEDYDLSPTEICDVSVKEAILHKYKGETLAGKYHGKGMYEFYSRRRNTFQLTTVFNLRYTSHDDSKLLCLNLNLYHTTQSNIILIDCYLYK